MLLHMFPNNVGVSVLEIRPRECLWFSVNQPMLLSVLMLSEPLFCRVKGLKVAPTSLLKCLFFLNLAFSRLQACKT